MSEQMTEDWIEQEFERWKVKPCYNPFGMDPDNYWMAKSFALYMFKKHSQKTSSRNTAQDDNKKTKTPDLHVKSTAQQ